MSDKQNAANAAVLLMLGRLFGAEAARQPEPGEWIGREQHALAWIVENTVKMTGPVEDVEALRLFLTETVAEVMVAARANLGLLPGAPG